ncbi:MAG: hypothetical protein ACLR1V_05905 [Coprococcus sp.]
MCGRYYIDTNWLDEIGNGVYSFDIDWKICKEQFQGDILPTNTAPIIEKTEHGFSSHFVNGDSPCKRERIWSLMQEQKQFWTSPLSVMVFGIIGL